MEVTEMGYSNTYIYALMNANDEIYYIGKTTKPLARLTTHRAHGDTNAIKMKIIDIVYDKEQYWIRKFRNEGYSLKNKEDLSEYENWQIGDIVLHRSKQKTIRVENLKTNVIYDTMKDAANDLKLKYHVLQQMKQNSNHKQHKVTPLKFYEKI